MSDDPETLTFTVQGRDTAHTHEELLTALDRLRQARAIISFDPVTPGVSFVILVQGRCLSGLLDGTPAAVARAIIDASAELLGEDTDTPTTEARER